MDLSKEEDICRVFDYIEENVGPISVLINMAGAIIEGLLIEEDPENWESQLDVRFFFF